jgi:DNA polymerase epsilon subunit 1
MKRERFFLHIKEARPTVIAAGDFLIGLSLRPGRAYWGLICTKRLVSEEYEDIYQSDYCVHMDCFSWVKPRQLLATRQSGLKAVTVAKLGYDPDELDPELMTR